MLGYATELAIMKKCEQLPFPNAKENAPYAYQEYCLQKNGSGLRVPYHAMQELWLSSRPVDLFNRRPTKGLDEIVSTLFPERQEATSSELTQNELSVVGRLLNAEGERFACRNMVDAHEDNMKQFMSIYDRRKNVSPKDIDEYIRRSFPKFEGVEKMCQLVYRSGSRGACDKAKKIARELEYRMQVRDNIRQWVADEKATVKSPGATSLTGNSFGMFEKVDDFRPQHIFGIRHGKR